MAKATPTERLSEEIASILSVYEKDIEKEIDTAVKEVAKTGAKALRAKSRQEFGGSGKYAKGWTSTTERGRHTATGIIYNKAKPGLPHLLEDGHLNRDGTRTPGRSHIAPVAEQIEQDFSKEVERIL